MGRHRSQDFNLPPRMHRKGDTFYYVTSTLPRKWIKLGKDLHQARLQWAELEREAPSQDDKTFAIIAKRYERDIIPGKAIRTQRDNLAELAKLLEVFGAVPIDAIRPQDVRTYLVSGNSPAFFPTPCPTQTLASQFNTGGETHGRGTQGQVAAA